VIRPQNTRWRLCRALMMLRDKQVKNPRKKHDNLPV
jgi:propionyl-CoA carboxylase beta chain